MNKTHSKVWSRALNQLVVASEIAACHRGGRQGQGGRRPLLRSLGPAAFTMLMASGWIGWASSAQAQSVDCTAAPYNLYNSATSCMGYGAKASGLGATALGGSAVTDVLGGVAVGYVAHSAGQNSISIGFGAYSTGVNSIYLGARTSAGSGALANSAIGIGQDVVASGTSAVAIGTVAKAVGGNTVALGALSSVDANSGNSVAIGPSASAVGAINAVVLGSSASASMGQGTALGAFTKTTGNGATAVGLSSQSLFSHATAVGWQAYATALNAVYLGARTVGTGASAESAIAIGTDVTSSGIYSIGMGLQANASQGDAIAIGRQAVATGINSIYLGALQSGIAGAGATASNAIAVGTDITASGTGAVALGNFTVASGTNSLALGASSATAQNAVAVGQQSGASAANATAIGFASKAQAASTVAFGDSNTVAAAAGTGSIAGGHNSQVKGGTGAVALGEGQTVTGNGAVAIGDPNTANGTGAVTMGANNVAAGDAGGTTAAAGAVAIGNSNQAIGQGSVALGNTSKALAAGGVAFGNAATATNANDVALGSGSTTDTAVGTASYTIGSTTYNFAGATPGSTVSVGALGAERTLTNVAAGRISGSSTDAINGSQLFATNQAVAALASGVDASAIHYFSVNDNGTTGPNYNNNGATGLNATAAGVAAVATGDGATALGNNTGASGVNSTAIGNGSTAAGSGAAAVGFHNFANGANSLSAGSTNKIYVNSATATAAAVGYDNAISGDGSAGFGDSNRVGNYAVDANKNYTRDGNGYLQPGGGTNVLRSYALGGDNIIGAVNADTNGASAVGAHNWVAGDSATATGSGNVVGTWMPGTDGVSAAIVASASHSTAVGDSNSTQSGFASVFGYANSVQAGSRYSTTVGAQNALSSGSTNATAIGSNNAISAVQAVAIGYQNTASALNAFAAGSGNVASGQNSIAVGVGNTVSGANSGAFGDPSTVTGTGSYSFGNNNSIASDNAFVLGSGVTIATGLNGAVALGNGTVVAASNPTASTTINGNTYNFAGAAPAVGGVVSVGAAGLERQITNVAAGRIDGSSTDAINGSQLFATNQAVENLSSSVTANATHYYSINDGGTIGGNYANDGATGLDALAAGVGASATADNGTALGQGTGVSVLGGVALGSGAVSDRAIAPSSGSILVGTNVIPYNTTDRNLLGAVSVGNATDFRQITNVADGTTDQDAVTLRQLKGAMSSFSVTPIQYFHANSTATDSAAIGAESVAIGPQTTVNGDNGIGMGNGAIVQQTAPGGTAIGQNATVNLADGVALGTNATSNGIQAMALGAGTQAAFAGSVALGAGSVTDAAVGTASTTLAGTTYNFAGTTPGSTVSVGVTGAERTITNVAAGRINGGSTDAINGSQLFATNQAVDDLSSTVTANAIHYYSVNDGGTQQSNYANNGATGLNALAAGPGSLAAGAGSVAIGHNSQVQGGIGAVAIGEGQTVNGDGAVAIGDPNTVSGTGAVGMGANNTANGSGAVALGNGNNAQGMGSVALGNTSSALAAGAVAFGSAATANNANDVALGSGSTTDTAVGTPNATINGTTYNFAGTTPTSTVSVGNPGNERTITNVAAGRINGGSTDAINGSQLFATNQAIGTVGATVTNLGASIANSYGGSTTYDPVTGTLNTGITYAGNTYSSLQSIFNQIGGVVNGGGIKYFHANSTLADSNAAGTDSVAIGPMSTANTTNAVSIGNGATAGTNAGDVALGAGSSTSAVVATTGGSIAGNTYTYAGTTPTSTVSVGTIGAERTLTNVAAGQVDGNSTDAINGSQLFATNQALETLNGSVAANATHYYSVNDGGTTGGNYTNNGATGLNALAAGVDASATADNGTALGQGSDVSVLGGVALGSGAVSDRAIAPTSGSILVGTNVIPYNTTDRNLLGAVSVGNATDFRQITNVADGTLDQDAVTLRQLKGAMSSFSVTPIKYFHANSTATDSAAIGAESVAIGPQTTVNGDNGIGLGNGAIVQQTAPGGTAIGQNATVNLADGVAMGTNAVSNGIQAMALGAGSQAAFAGSVALGAGSVTDAAVGTTSTTLAGTTYNFAGAAPGSTVSVGGVGAERTLTNVAAGRISGTSTDAINGSQLYATNQTLEGLYSQFNILSNTVNNLPSGGGTTVNNTFQTSTDNTTQASSSGDNSTAAGAGSTASGSSSTAIGAGSTASGDNSVAIGAGSVASQANSVSVGSVGNERTVTNVAAGVNSTDAVNVDQLNQAIEAAKDWSKDYVDHRFQSVDRDLNRIGNRADAGIAAAMAMASLPQAYQPNQSSAAVALGSFHGEAGIAIGVSTITESGRYVFKLNATSNSRGDTGAGVGAGVVW